MPDRSNLEPHNSVLLRRASIASVLVAVSLIVVKLIAFFVTDSVSLLSSLVDSVLDMFASVVNFFAVRQALVPADEQHRFGHGKAEPLAGLGQAAFISGSSLFICFESFHRLLQPVQIQQGYIGMLVMVFSLAATFSLVLYQRSVIRRTRSLAIEADSLHYASDIAVNIGVILALVLAVNFGWVYADPVFALGIAVFIIYSAWKIFSQSLDQLMDKELSEEQRNSISAIALACPGVRDIHDLRTRTSGRDTFIQIHMETDGDQPLRQAHDIAMEVQARIQAAFPNADVIIHQDPI